MADKHIKLGKGSLSVRWSLLDQAIEAISPAWAGKRLQARVGHALSAQMAGYHGASHSRRSLAGWNPGGGDADADTLADLPALRHRSRDLIRNAPIAGGAIGTTCAYVVGTGLSLESTLDTTFLGLTEDQADAWQQDTERKFNGWWESTDCDITRTQTGYGLQNLALLSELADGDAFAVLTAAPWATGPVRLAVQLIDADRCSNPDRKPDTDRLVAGIQSDANGAPERYHFASANPYRGPRSRAITWSSVPAFGSKTGRRNVLHLFDRSRIGLTRGVPMLAPVIEPIKQIERYTEAELMAAVVSGMFTVFIQTEGSANLQPSALDKPAQASGAGASGPGWNGQLGNGLVVELGQGETINSANPGRPNAQFDPFVASIIRQIGMRLGIPYEVLIKHYTSSYTAARAAILDAWRHFRTRRDRHATYFCQPIYAAWLDEAVASGHVSAPGYFADPLRRRAWQAANWIGDGPGSVDPVKDVTAARDRIDLGISTHQAESILHDGGKFRSKVRQLQRERRWMAEGDDTMPRPVGAAQRPQTARPGTPPGSDDGDADQTDDDLEDPTTGRPVRAPAR